MGFVNGGGKLVGANMKKNGSLLIQIEVEGDLGSDGDYARLRRMMNKDVSFSMDSQVVNYNVQINMRTEKPIREYRVDEHGLVSEVKPEGEQLEMDLGVQTKPDPVEDKPTEISREVVDEFIMSGLAPRPEKHWYPVQEWVERLAEGETYLKLANEAGISSGQIVDIVDDYRQSVAPMAAKWDEWRQAKAEQPEPPKQEEPEQSEDVQEVDETVTDEPETEEVDDTAVEEYILSARPAFDDIPYDFPVLLEQRKSGETWMNIAASLGITSGQLATSWRKYKDYVRKLLSEDKGAA